MGRLLVNFRLEEGIDRWVDSWDKGASRFIGNLVVHLMQMH